MVCLDAIALDMPKFLKVKIFSAPKTTNMIYLVVFCGNIDHVDNKMCCFQILEKKPQCHFSSYTSAQCSVVDNLCQFFFNIGSWEH